MRIWHQLLASAIVTWGIWAGARYGNLDAVRELAKVTAMIPVVAIPYLFIASLAPDGDGNGAITKHWILAPGFFVLRFFVSHRGFTHRVEWIALLWFLLWLLSRIQLTLPMVAIGTAISLTILWTVFNKNWIRTILTCIMVFFAPLLLIPAYFEAFLIAFFVAYVCHMFGDVVTSEGWTIAKLGSKRIHIQLPFAFNAGWWFERTIIYPILCVSIIYFIFWEFDFWKVKLLKESGDLIEIYKSLLA